MKTASGTTNWPLRMAAALLCLALASTYLASNLYARYTTTAEGTDTARVAAFSFNLQDGASSKLINLSGISKPGDTQTYEFAVSGNGSETALSYTVGVSLQGSLPLQAALQQSAPGDSTTSTQAISVDSAVSSSEGNVAVATADAVNIPAGDTRSRTYTLTVLWPPEQIDAQYASGAGASVLELNINAQQID